MAEHVTRGSVAFHEAVARGVVTAREHIREILSTFDSEYSNRLSAERRETIRKRVEEFISNDEVWRKVDADLQETIETLRSLPEQNESPGGG